MRSMKHSIKREQSHARMSFAECENQRSLAEGESNVRATLKHMKLSFNLILTLAAMLMIAQTAWAADETKTFTVSSVTGSGNPLSYDGKTFISATGNESIQKGATRITLRTPSSGNEGTIRLYPRISGKVKELDFSNARVSMPDGDGNSYVKIGKGSDWTNSYTSSISDLTQMTFTHANGIQLENDDDYLEIKLYNPVKNCTFIIEGTITITYEPTASTQTHTHNFTFIMNDEGNALTATCAHNDGKTCDLASSNYQATLTLSPSVDTYYRPNSTYSAKLNLGAFNTATGLNATATDITYVNNTTSDNLGSTAPTTAGNYTASVTVTVGGKDYTLSTDFKVNAENSINNNIRQISVSKTSAANDEEITITFTPRSHELVNTLTVTGATTNKSIGNGITKVDEYTYTFTMPFEEVTIGATFKSSDASLYKYAITTDITGSGAVDYNAEEYLGAGDAITITFMPYLQGNLEAGSVVLEGLTVTGATTSMSVGNGITDNGGNTYTFTMPGENVTVTAKAYLSADAILAGTINEPIYIKQGNGIQIGCNNKWTYVNDGALPLVIPDGNTLRLAGGTDVRLDLADKNAIACEGDAIVELIPNEVSNDIGIGDRPERNSGKATIKVGPAGKTLTIRVADESTETVHLTVKSISQCDRNCDVIGCDEGGSCGSIVVESGQVESREYFNDSGRAFRTTDGTITFGYKYPNDEIIFDGGSEGTVKIEDGKQFHSYYDYNTKYSGTINLQGINYFYARPDKYTVTFDENGGSAVDNQTVAHGMKATKPATTREGYTFVRWNNGEDAYDFNTVVTNDLTLKAEWKRPITSEGISITIPSQEWTGSELKPVITVTDGETELTLNTDYTVTAPIGTVQNTGNYTYTITGAGNYSGETTATFTITPKAVTITLSEEYGTYCSTVDLDFSEATGLTAYIAAGYNKSEGSLLMVKVTSVPKGTGLLLKGTAGSTYTAKGQTSPYVYSNLLTGTTAETNVTADDFILGKKGDKVGFYHAEAGTLAAGKAYLDHTKLGTSTSGARMLSLEFYDDATGIADVRSKMSDAVTEDWYSLDGRKLQGRPTKKGLYLLNGKKVVIR